MAESTLRALKARLLARVPPGVHGRVQRARNRARHTQQAAFDRAFGVDTAGLVRPDAMGVVGPTSGTGNHYEATWRGSFLRMVRSLGLDLTGFTFVDVGSGKGAVLLYASELPFRRVVGIEHSPALHRIAEDNLRRYRPHRRRCADVTSVCADALGVELDPEPTVLFLCNPFEGEPMHRLMAGVEASVRAHPRPLYVLSFNPAVERVLDEQSWLERVGKGWNHAAYRSRAEQRSVGR